MAFAHGKNTVFKIDDVGGSVRDISAYLDDVDFSAFNADTSETSVFGVANKTYLSGLISGTITISGTYDPTVSGYLQGIVGQVEGDFEYGPAGSTGGFRKYAGKCICTSYSEKGSIGDVVKFTASFQISGAVTPSTY